MAAHADQYDDFAVISSTLGVQDGRVCVGEASRGDIGCPTYAPYVATDGSISATRFVGDGSGLFNIAGASADRIVSGTTSMLTISDTGYISITQSGYNTAYFHPTLGLVAVGVSSTGGISGTTGYFSNNARIDGTIDLMSTFSSTVVGRDAGSPTIGSLGTLFGYEAGAQTGGALNMVGVGYRAGYASSANNLTAVGTMAGREINGYQDIVAVGRYAAYRTSGSWVVAAGSTAGYNSVGSYTTYIGYDAGRTSNGASVTALGYRSGYNNTFSNVVLLGANTLATNNNQVVLGAPTIVEVTTTGVILAAGVSTTGTISATRFVGDGSGLTGVGVSDLYALSHVSATEETVNSLFLGTTTGAVAAPPETTAIGVGALADPANTGPANTAVGMQALASNTVGQWNTAVGRKALRANTTGTDNIAVGVKALDMNTIGTQNVAMGMSAMSFVSNSIGNVAIGLQALGRPIYLQETVAVGFRAGQGVNNVSSFTGGTLLGAYAGYGITTGNSNTLIGHRSGYGLTTGSGNIALGFGTNLYSSTGNYQLNIGNVIYGDIGRGADSRIGINVTSPTTNFEVSGTVSATLLQVANTAPDSACVGTSDLGKMRRNPTTGRMQVCR